MKTHTHTHTVTYKEGKPVFLVMMGSILSLILRLASIKRVQNGGAHE